MSDIFLASTALEQIVGRLVDGLHPDRIYLFGSQAHGKGTRDSDFDLLVIVPESNLPRHQREAYSYDLLWGLTTPVDVVVLTKEEFDRTSQVKTSLASTVKAHGEILYHAP
jgi:predicted nucleotidyltransferase